MARSKKATSPYTGELAKRGLLWQWDRDPNTNVFQGIDRGLALLCEHYGIDVPDPTRLPAPPALSWYFLSLHLAMDLVPYF